MQIKYLIKVKSLLFDNKTIKQTIFKNTFWLAIAEGISRFMTFILFIYIARILGASDYGKFSFALAILNLCYTLPGFLSADIITRELSQEKEKEKEYSSIFSLKIFLALATIIFTIAISFLVNPDPIIRKVIWIMSIYFLFNVLMEVPYAFFRARQRMEYESFFKILDAVLTTTFGLFVIFKFPSLENLSYAYLLEGLVLLFIALLFFHFKIYRLSFGWDKMVWRRMLFLSWPLALVGIMTVVYNQTDLVMMGFLRQMSQSGWYNAASRIAKITLAPISFFSLSFYPVLAKFFKESKENLQKIWSNQMRIMIIIAIPLVVGGIALAPKIINFVYDKSYTPSIFAFQILIVTTGIIFLYNTFQQVLIVANQQKMVLWAVLSGAIINIIFNLILIPKFSLYGAAFTTIITNLVILFLLFKFTLKFTTVKPLDSTILLSFLAASFSSGVMYLVIRWQWIYQLPVLISILIGAIIYFVTAIILFRHLNFLFRPSVLFKKL